MPAKPPVVPQSVVALKRSPFSRSCPPLSAICCLQGVCAHVSQKPRPAGETRLHCFTCLLASTNPWFQTADEAANLYDATERHMPACRSRRSREEHRDAESVFMRRPIFSTHFEPTYRNEVLIRKRSRPS